MKCTEPSKVQVAKQPSLPRLSFRRKSIRPETSRPKNCNPSQSHKTRSSRGIQAPTTCRAFGLRTVNTRKSCQERISKKQKEKNRRERNQVGWRRRRGVRSQVSSMYLLLSLEVSAS
ncbi:unnamed protein product [Caenorhabditis nigoni]